jgi:hypothetical protein
MSIFFSSFLIIGRFLWRCSSTLQYKTPFKAVYSTKLVPTLSDLQFLQAFGSIFLSLGDGGLNRRCTLQIPLDEIG